MNNIPIIIKLEQFGKSIYINVNHIVKIEANDDFQTDLLSSISLVDQTIINVFESQDEVIDKINRKIKSLRDLCRKQRCKMYETYELFRSSEELNKKIESEQFPYSEEILSLRGKIDLPFLEIARRLDISAEEYIEYEYCNLEIPVEKYQIVIEKLKEIINETQRHT